MRRAAVPRRAAGCPRRPGGWGSYPNSRWPPGSWYVPAPIEPFLLPSRTQLGCAGLVTTTPTPIPGRWGRVASPMAAARCARRCLRCRGGCGSAAAAHAHSGVLWRGVASPQALFPPAARGRMLTGRYAVDSGSSTAALTRVKSNELTTKRKLASNRNMPPRYDSVPWDTGFQLICRSVWSGVVLTVSAGGFS